MYKYFWIGTVKLPTYGVVVLLGILVVHVIADHIIHQYKLNVRQFVLIEWLGGIGAIVGAKGLALLEKGIACKFQIDAATTYDGVGYSYYGGLFAFLLAIYWYGMAFDVDTKRFSDKLMFLLPLLHGIWKVGCYLGGCCVGRTFPVQLAESATAIVICVIMIVMGKRNEGHSQVAIYLQLYGITRFVLEFFRFHEGGSVWALPHTMSCICFGAGLYIGRQQNRGT